MKNAALTFSRDIQHKIEKTLNWQSTSIKKDLTEREQEVLNIMSLGWDDEASALALQITTHTYRHHRKTILNKLNASNKVEAIAKAFRSQLICW